jgi:two-component system phosphate regulon sensor histidine kinase PhoR
MSAPGRITPPLLALPLAIAGAVLAAFLPHPLKLLMGGPLLALGLGLLLYQLLRAESPHQRALRRLEEELLALRTRAEREDQLRKGILASLREGVLVFGEDRRLLLANPAAVRLMGTGSRLGEGAGLAEAFRDPESLAQLETAFRGEAAQWTLRREPRVLRVRALPFQAGLEARGTLVTLDDVTRMEALETTRQKFISNASHELKTPVTAIRVAAENLQDGGSVLAEGDSSLRTIFRALEKMTLLLDDVSELSRIETGALVLEPRALAVAGFARELLEDLEPQARAKGVGLELGMQEGLEGLRMQADPLRLHQLLENLLSNAVKFSPSGALVHLDIAKEEGALRWTIRDQGPGIPGPEQGRVFERFYRTSSARAVPGTGLGLAIVKHLARLMGGEITLQSEAGKGATFTFKMPLQV